MNHQVAAGKIQQSTVPYLIVIAITTSCIIHLHVHYDFNIPVDLHYKL